MAVTGSWVVGGIWKCATMGWAPKGPVEEILKVASVAYTLKLQIIALPFTCLNRKVGPTYIWERGLFGAALSSFWQKLLLSKNETIGHLKHCKYPPS